MCLNLRGAGSVLNDSGAGLRLAMLWCPRAPVNEERAALMPIFCGVGHRTSDLPLVRSLYPADASTALRRTSTRRATRSCAGMADAPLAPLCSQISSYPREKLDNGMQAGVSCRIFLRMCAVWTSPQQPALGEHELRSS